jgi:hypothetical protein
MMLISLMCETGGRAPRVTGADNKADAFPIKRKFRHRACAWRAPCAAQHSLLPDLTGNPSSSQS